MVQLNYMKRKKRYLVFHGCILIGFLPVKIAEMGVENGNPGADESASLYELTPSDVLALEECIPLPS